MLRFVNFLRSTQGVTTIEWVVLCAVVLVAALAITSNVMTGATDLGDSVADQMEEAAD